MQILPRKLESSAVVAPQNQEDIVSETKKHTKIQFSQIS